MSDELNVEDTGNATEVAPETNDQSTEDVNPDTQQQEAEVKTDDSVDVDNGKTTTQNAEVDVEKLQKELNLSKMEANRIKNQLKDPNFVYGLAQQAGLTEDSGQPTPIDINQAVANQIAAVRDYDKAIEILPDLAKDPELETWARGLVENGMSHQDAAKHIKERLETTKEAAKVEGAKSKEVEISEKEAAQTAPIVGNVDSEAHEIESLKEDAKSLNRVKQEDALAKLIAKNL